MEDQKPVLTYFEGNGKGSLIRAVFATQNVDFEDRKLEIPDFITKMKAGNFEFDSLPVLDIDGLNLTQNGAILNYIGKKYNLLGKNAAEEYYINSMLSSGEDLIKLVFPVIFPQGEQLNELDKLKKDFVEALSKYLKAYEATISKVGGKHVIGDNLTLADFYLGIMIGGFIKKFELIEFASKETPKLLGHVMKLKDGELKVFFEKYFISGAGY